VCRLWRADSGRVDVMDGCQPPHLTQSAEGLLMAMGISAETYKKGLREYRERGEI